MTGQAIHPGVEVRARGRWPEPGDTVPPPVRGFAISTFGPVVVQAAVRCLERAPAVPADAGGATALVLVSARADQTTAGLISVAVDAGRRVAPMVFFQSVPNSVLGHLAAELRLTGPVVCVSPVGDPVAEGFEIADGLFRDGDATRALVIVADQDQGPDRGGGLALDPPASGTALALLVVPSDNHTSEGGSS
ncbi:beta-ketoacyl synthase chain length factor [Micromonospora sp. NPDC007271]|uniref:beta-ketoacyl synthase chain length factor n=1 Tax=Micromonospora sp. NPDC007271 TaxID=3154587 RepID=UPI0033C1CED9